MSMKVFKKPDAHNLDAGIEGAFEGKYVVRLWQSSQFWRKALSFPLEKEIRSVSKSIQMEGSSYSGNWATAQLGLIYLLVYREEHQKDGKLMVLFFVV